MKSNKTKIAFFLLIIMSLLACGNKTVETPLRVFVFTDINIDRGDPDDRQSLIHLLWYTDILDLQGIVPHRWEAQSLEACKQAFISYGKDYTNFRFGQKGYPAPDAFENLCAIDFDDAINRFHEAASEKTSPLYVLLWGNMHILGEALRLKPELSNNIRVISIGTDLMMEENRQYTKRELTEKPCEQSNYNGQGRNQIFNDPRFNNMWWLEINWTYEGMFSGEEPQEMFHKLAKFGNMGKHMKEVVENQPWAQYFRVGDTPSVLYLIDQGHNLNDPTQSSWAGKFSHPFPNERPNYFTDLNGSVEWDYTNPCNTWENHIEMNAHAKSTLESRRSEMYEALIEKLDKLYKYNSENKSI